MSSKSVPLIFPETSPEKKDQKLLFRNYWWNLSKNLKDVSEVNPKETYNETWLSLLSLKVAHDKFS